MLKASWGILTRSGRDIPIAPFELGTFISFNNVKSEMHRPTCYQCL